MQVLGRQAERVGTRQVNIQQKSREMHVEKDKNYRVGEIMDGLPDLKQELICEFSKLMHELVYENVRLQKSGEFDKFFSICAQDITILALIGEKEKLTARQISRILSLPKTTIVTAAARLVKRGYLQRKQNEADRREFFLTLTDKGEEINREHERYEKTFLEALCGMWEEEAFPELLEVLFCRRNHNG